MASIVSRRSSLEIQIPGVRLCAGCDELRTEDEWSVNKSGKNVGKPASYCKKCMAKRASKYWRADPALRKAASRRARMKKVYGISPEEYDAQLTAQGGLCGLCGAPEAGWGRKRLAVDHCHDTGRLRGLLCHSCNVGIGHLRHNSELLRLAIEYVEKSEWR